MVGFGFGHKCLCQDWTTPFLLQVLAEGNDPQLTLTFRTLGGNIAASINWTCADSPVGLPEAVLSGIRSYGFTCPVEPLRAINLRLLKPDGALVDVGADAAAVAEQLASHRQQ